MSWETHYREVRAKKPLVWPDINVIRQVSRLDLKSDARLLDLGCGEGRNIRALLELGFRQVYGADQSAAALEIVKSRYQLPQQQLLCGSVPDVLTPFSAQHFDMVLCWGLMHYLKQPEVTLQAISHVLKSGASLIISFNAKEERRTTVDTVKSYYDDNEIRQLIERAGLTIQSIGKVTDENFTDGRIESYYWLTARK
ncbi:MAG: class I SAM-dependent methyltransferase [Gammaproteobacteria bacterium]|nr:class I SAM-dependent methyltransferase [Gammaproteobacteria bacterium]MBU1476427.1 class I SAM-dependent methyltransferase [Gammaproteobacteria bacterium]MBU2003161.1 class I SAM-dependent methyltransferase [Gammaproteobacteria bacterium]MBU2130546.1 class I SAM-dependent methyltransferase [Gammaproteobacteria bacterium]MBU2187095.1 class I SAM-dependent methyltransferase [Gammaproteobacteria bacterium]